MVYTVYMIHMVYIIYIYMYTHIHTYIHIYIYIYLCGPSPCNLPPSWRPRNVCSAAALLSGTALGRPLEFSAAKVQGMGLTLEAWAVRSALLRSVLGVASSGVPKLTGFHVTIDIWVKETCTCEHLYEAPMKCGGKPCHSSPETYPLIQGFVGWQVCYSYGQLVVPCGLL